MQTKRNEKRTLTAMIITFIFLVAGIALWAIFDYFNTNQKEGLGIFLIALIVAVFGAKLLYSKYQSVKRGEPIKDERSRRLERKAAAYAFYIGIYWLLALGMVIDYFAVDIPARSVPGAGIGGMALIFGLAYWYFSRKGE